MQGVAFAHHLRPPLESLVEFGIASQPSNRFIQDNLSGYFTVSCEQPKRKPAALASQNNTHPIIWCPRIAGMSALDHDEAYASI